MVTRHFVGFMGLKRQLLLWSRKQTFATYVIFTLVPKNRILHGRVGLFRLNQPDGNEGDQTR